MLPVLNRTRHGPKPFAWSWSKIKNYETCARRHHHVDILKDFKDADDTKLKYGNDVHTMLEHRLKHGTELPPMHAEKLEPWAKWVEEGDGKVLVEQQLAITRDMKACEWFSPAAWFRARIDVLKTTDMAGIIVDWKTGKVKDDSAQLMLNAAATFYHHPSLQIIKSYFVWLEQNETSDVVLRRDQLTEMWGWLWPRIEALREAYEAEAFDPTPSYLCASYCPVKTCEHHGKRI